MKKMVKTILVLVCMLLLSVQVFGATENNIAYINKMKINDVGSTQVIIDNSNFDLKPGQYFGISLENAEFDLDKNDYPIAMSEHFEFQGSSKKWLSLRVKDSVTEGGRLSFSFHSKLKGPEAKLIIDPEDSGITGGTYVYATTGEKGSAAKGEIDTIRTTSLNNELKLGTITIREKASSAFRTVQMDNTSKKPLITIQADEDLFRLRSSQNHDPITFVVDDGDDREKRYRLGQDDEVTLDVDQNKIIFQEDNEEIFSTVGHNYTVKIENISVFPVKGKLRSSDVKLKFNGELLDEQVVSLGHSSASSLEVETSQDDLKPGSKQKIKFLIDEGIGNTLFKDGYIYLGVYGGAKLDSKSSLEFTLKEGINTYTEKETRAFKVELDPMGDRITIKDYHRQGERSPMTIQGTLELTIPEGAKKDIEFFVSEPSLTEAVVKTVLLGTDKVKPVEPQEPQEPETPKDPARPTVTFQIDNQTYTVGGVGYLLDMKPYISTHERIMVPFRYLAYALGVEEDDLKWDNLTKTISLEGDQPMTIHLATGQMLVDGKRSSLSETRLLNGRTFVPVGEIARAFGVKVDWDGETRTAIFN